MATLTITVCDECRKEARRLIKIGDGVYCSRECYLAVCKRVFDSNWMEALKLPASSREFRKTNSRFYKVA